GTEIERERAFVTALRYLENRIKLFLALPIDKLEAVALTAKLHEIGQADSAVRHGDAA
ncbi:MAG TPA: arsenate reductase ArsC, partial [Hyphomicrobium sp.]|nr:arsenate reductase ArsC [Hyphomicrobium sp.]